MSNNSTLKWADEQRKREKEARQAGYPVCLHCKNPFPPSAGVVTADAAICDVCNGD